MTRCSPSVFHVRRPRAPFHAHRGRGLLVAARARLDPSAFGLIRSGARSTEGTGFEAILASKTWRLVVTELGASTPLSEVSVEAANWMSAIAAGRKEIGESGGVPTGASCAVAPDGRVTIHDPVARRSYMLTPSTPPSRPPPPAPQIPADEAPRPDPRAQVAQPPKKKKPSRQTIAYDMSQHGSLPAVPPSASTPIAISPPEPPRPPQPVAPPAVAPAPSTPAAAPPPPPAAVPELVLLAERAEDPRPDSPLCYRERTFVVAAGVSAELAEDLLREQFGRLRAELDERPPGKFFNLAVFDHRWEGRPLRAPVVTLQWKDWRGDPVVARPLAAGASASLTPPAVSMPPAESTRAKEQAPPSGVVMSPPPAARQRQRTPSAQFVTAALQGRQRTRTDEQDARLVHAFEASQDLFFLGTPVEGLEFAVKLLGELVPTEAASACLYDINTDELRFVTLTGPGAEARRGEAVPSGSGLIGKAASVVQAIVVEDATAEPQFDPGVDGRVGMEMKSFLIMPVSHQGRLLGMLQLINRQNRPAFTTGDGDVVAYVAEQLGQFLYQARIAPDRPRASRS